MSECCKVDFIIEDCPPVPFLIGDGDGVLEMELANPIIRTGVYPDYEGAYQFIPTTEAQVIHTRHSVLMDNITIAPIPKTYGLITYNGSFITVS